jgi:hypothetical protein
MPVFSDNFIAFTYIRTSLYVSIKSNIHALAKGFSLVWVNCGQGVSAHTNDLGHPRWVKS